MGVTIVQKDISNKVKMSKTSSGLVLKDIGNLLQIREEIDKFHRATDAIRSRFFVADFIPLRYNLNYKCLQSSEAAVSYNFADAITEFQTLCFDYNMANKFAGIRLWMTDDTTVTENFSNEYSENVIQSKIAAVSGIGQQIRDFAKASGTAVGETFKKISDFTGKAAASVSASAVKLAGGDEGIAQVVSGNVSGLVGTAAELILQGKAISLPKVWKNSTYNPAVSFTVKLVSPYGSPEAINKYVLEPLLYILLLTSPRTVDGLSYGLPRPIRVRAYGLTNINLGMVQNVTVNRGGGSAAFNQYKQPLTIDVVITVSPLTDGFAAMSGKNRDMVQFNTDVGKFEDKVHSGNEYSNFGKTSAITTVGNIIQSLAPAPDNVVYRYGSRIPGAIMEVKTPEVTPNATRAAQEEVKGTEENELAIDVGV